MQLYQAFAWADGLAAAFQHRRTRRRIDGIFHPIAPGPKHHRRPAHQLRVHRRDVPATSARTSSRHGTVGKSS